MLFDIDRRPLVSLNIGVEEVSGSSRCVKRVAFFAKASFSHFDYHGFVEGDDIGKGVAELS